MRFALRALVVATITAPLFSAAAPAHAQGFFFWSDPPPRPRERVYRRPEISRPRPARPAASRPAEAEVRTASLVTSGRGVVHPGVPLVAVVSLKNQSITVWDHSGPVLRSKVSTGQSGHATPAGLFSVIQKNRYHESNIYSGAPMPWMHRITWSGIALHAGVVPNYPASHGCIRLPYDFAPKLWAVSRMGMRVVVAPSDTAMSMIDEQALPAPLLSTAGEVAALLRAGKSAAPSPLPATDAPDRLYNPVEVATLLRKHAAANVEASKVAAKEALSASVLASAEANAVIAEARAAAAALQVAEANARLFAQTADAETNTQDQVDRAAAKIDADAKLTEARQRLASAALAEADKDPRAFQLARVAREAEAAADAAPDLLKDAARRLEPISVFVSRKEGQVFVRQGFEPILDAPVVIEDALEPLGTHVFTAMSAAEDGKSLKWSAVTMPSHEAHGSALDALKRITLPPQVKEEIARRVWTGASLIISDHGISNETGKGTDFVILTK